MLEEYQGKTIEGVYACYAVTPETESILRTISEKIMAIINDIPEENKPAMKVPHYHLTLEYKGKVADIKKYIAEVLKKKSAGSGLDLVKHNAWTSNVTGNSIPYLEPGKGVYIPFAIDKATSPHVTLLEITNSWKSFRWFILCLDRIADAWKETCEALPEGAGIELDISKVQIRGKVDGEKKLIVEV